MSKKTFSNAEKEIDRLDTEFKKFDDEVKTLTLDRMNETAKKPDLEPQTKIAQADLQDIKRVVLKPVTSINNRDKFNERFRKDWEFKKEMVHFTAENREIIGEDIEMWTRPFGGVPAEFWRVPTNKPIWAPRYVAEGIKGCKYHRLTMKENHVTNSDGYGNYTGTMVADQVIQRLDAHPVHEKTSIFMGSQFGT